MTNGNSTSRNSLKRSSPKYKKIVGGYPWPTEVEITDAEQPLESNADSKDTEGEGDVEGVTKTEKEDMSPAGGQPKGKSSTAKGKSKGRSSNKIW